MPVRCGGKPSMRPERLLLAILLWIAAGTVPEGGRALAHTARDPQDAVLEGVGVDERPGAAVPPGLVFRDGAGVTRRMGSLTSGGPSILSLNYYSCPMICSLQLRNLADVALRIASPSLSRDYRMITVSIDPQETPEAANARAAEVYGLLGGTVPDTRDRWPLLYGDAESIRLLARAIGFRYVKAGTEYAHPIGVVVLTPEGTVSRYLYGIQPDPRDVRLALLEAAGGRIGSLPRQVANAALLACFHYDPEGKKYVLYAANVMAAAAGVVALSLGTLLVVLWRREKGGAARPGGEGGC